MGSTTPSSLSSRTRGREEFSAAATEGIRKKIAQAQKVQRRKKAATNSDCLRQKERFLSWNRSLMAHLLLVFSHGAWNSANVRAIAWLQYSLSPASAPFLLPLAR